jgi:putative transposase
MMVAFIDAHRATYGVEPICQMLPVAPSTYYAAKAAQRDTPRVCARRQREATLVPAIDATWRGFVYVAFVLDVFSRRIVGWRATTHLRTDLALDVLEQALHDRETDGPLIHHSDRGTQYVSIRDTDRLREAGVEPSVGSTGDSYDNAMAESVIGLFKPEVIHHLGPWRGLDDVSGPHSTG